MNTGQVLQGKTILVTRPLLQAQTLAQQLRQFGAEVKFLPALTVEPNKLTVAAQQKLQNLSCYGYVIFVSPNAVRIAMECLQQLEKKYPAAMATLAIGPSTAKVLANYSIPAQYPQQANSEALLALPFLQQLAGKKILLIQGTESRGLLPVVLQQRQAQLDVIELYTTSIPSYTQQHVRDILQQSAVDILLATSGQIIHNLLTLAEQGGADCKQRLLSLPLLVVSERLKAIAMRCGFQSVVVAQAADDQSILLALNYWFNTSRV